MNIQEYEVVKNYSYNDYCKFLNNKYVDYSKDGLFKHHFYEYRKAGLSNPEVEGTAEEKTTIIFCDYLEHLLLHIMIGEQTDARKALGIGGAINYIIPQLNNYFYNNIKCYNNSYYNNLDIEVFNILIDRADHAINNINVALDHNKQLYLEVENKFNTIGKALIVLGTGLGKTSTSLEYLIANKCRALVVAPNNLIKTGWEEYSDWVDTISYQAFSNNFNEIDLSKYGLVIADEVHHAGAEVWGKPIQECLNKGIKVLGLTATPQRTDGNDIGITLFDDAVCEGYSVEEGIEKGLIHPFSYITALYDTDGIHDEYASCDNKELVGNLDLALNNCPSLKDIFIKNMPAGERKGIIFIQDIADEKYVKDIMTEIYPDIQYKSIHSRMDKSSVEANRTWFENTDSGYLLAVNMISEGAHYKGVNTLIMFRRTSSYLVFTQQLGRIITLVKDENPNAIVFDLVNNIDRIEYSNRRVDKNRFNISRIVTALKKTNAAKSKQIVVKDCSRDIVKAIRDIKAFSNQKWTEEEIQIITEFYAKFHADNNSGARINLKELEKLLPRKNRGNIINEAVFLGLSKKKRKWSEYEDSLIKTYYPIEGASIISKLPSRSKNQISQRAAYLGIKYSKSQWSDQEIKFLIANYGKISNQELADALNIPLSRVLSKAYSLKLKHYARAVRCIETNAVFNNTNEAAISYDLYVINKQAHNIIRDVCRGKRDSFAGYHWKYVEEEG